MYTDEDVDVLIAVLLRARGFSVLTTRDARRLRATDEEQLAFATAAQRTLVTHNRVDFEALHHAYLSAGKDHAGIIIARRHPAQEIVQRLLIILNAVTADEMQNQLRYI